MSIFKSNSITKLSLILAFGILGLGLTSCNEERDLGDITIQEREMDDFFGVDLGGLGNAQIISSTEFKVVVRTHANLLDDVITTIEGGILKIDLIGNHKSIDVLEYKVYMPSCNYVKLDDVGNIQSEDGFTSESLKVIQNGVGNIQLQNIMIDELDAELNDVGNISLSGTANAQSVLLDGVGNYLAFDLATDTTDAVLTGVGDIKISVQELLRVKASGVGTVYYKGNPVVDANISGTGGLVKVD